MSSHYIEPINESSRSWLRNTVPLIAIIVCVWSLLMGILVLVNYLVDIAHGKFLKLLVHFIAFALAGLWLCLWYKLTCMYLSRCLRKKLIYSRTQT